MFFGSILLCFFGGAQPAEKIDELIRAYEKLHQFNGTALVAKGDAVLLNKGYGWKRAATKIPTDGSTIYQIGSVTKQFTAAVVLYLEEKGQLSLTDKLSKYFPRLPYASKITVHHLLTHTSGLYNYTNDSKVMKVATRPVAKEALFASFQNKPLNFEPGDRFQYSNTNYILLGYIIEKVTGKKYENVIKELIFTPLGMKNSGFDFVHLANANKATGFYLFSEEKKTEAVPVDSTVSYAAGAIYSTTLDVLKWNRAIAQRKVLSTVSWNKMLVPYKDGYGYGIMVDSLYGRKRIGHDGDIFGFSSMVVQYENEEYVIVLLANIHTSVLNKMATDIGSILFNQPYQLPVMRKEIMLSTDTLKQYIGQYQFSPQFIISVWQKKNELWAQATGQSPFQLYALSQNRFFLKAVEAEIEFVKDAQNRVAALVLYQGEAIQKGNKIK